MYIKIVYLQKENISTSIWEWLIFMVIIVGVAEGDTVLVLKYDNDIIMVNTLYNLIILPKCQTRRKIKR